MTLYKWSQTAASNATADATINWAEGQAPASVNDSSRAEMAAVAKYRDDSGGSLTTGGTSTAYTLTSNQVFNSLANMSGKKLKVRFNATNGAAPTLNVDGLGAKAIQTASGTAVATGAILADSVHDLTYDNSIPAWLLSGAFAGSVGAFPGNVSVGGTLAVTGAVTLSSTLAVTGASTLTGNTTVGGTLGVTGAFTGSSTIAGTNITASGALSGATVAGAMIATQAQMETGTATDLLVAPGRQKSHPLHPKAWAKIAGSDGSVEASSGVTSCTRNGAGDYTITWSTAFSSNDYCVVGTARLTTNLVVVRVHTLTTTTARVTVTKTTDGAETDPSQLFIIAMGDQ